MQSMKLHIYMYTRSLAEQLHFATTFISSLAKHTSKDIPHLLDMYQATTLCGHD